MSLFDDDPFDEIVREFFGERPGRARKERIIRGEEEDRTIDFIEEDEKVYVVFELPGFSEKDVAIEVNGKDLEIIARKENGENVQGYLTQRLRQGTIIKKTLPGFVNTKKFSHSMRNGILEVIFDRK